ncbi:MAG TPA: O-antigen ligase family protein [Gaiellaceae bacterium]|nr:O-antigen ligase family protein [Gaiellaceae bacterium]
MRVPAAWGIAAAGLAFAALFLSDGSSQSRVFWIGVPAVVLAAVGWAWRPRRLPPWGVAFFCALAAFVVWQAVSIAWSIQPSRSWDYANRGLVYFAFAAVGALVGGVPLRRFAAAASVLLGALFAWALAAKVIPGLYPDYERLARLRYPLGYWNELALIAAASVPLGLWAVGVRHDRRARIGGALLLYLGLVVAVLTYSRVGIVLTVVAAVVSLWLDRDRLTVLGPLALAWIAAAVVTGVGLLLPGVSSDGQPHDVRVQDGLLFGAALVAGAVVVVLGSRIVLARTVDRRVARGAAIALVVLLLVALAGAVVHAGGPGDFLSARWHEFSNKVSAQIPNEQDRLISVSSSNRWRWWTEAWNAFTDRPLQGTGAGTFELVDRVERTTPLATTEPHSVPLQFLSESGIVGFLLYVAVIVCAVMGFLRRERSRAWLAFALGAALCLVHSFVDIDWDFVAVQGPLFLTVGALVSQAPAPPSPGRRWLASVAIAVCALAAAYSLASPWLAANRVAAAYDALERNDPAKGRTDARSAHAFNPLSVDAIFVLALVEPDAKALQLYRRAVDLEPENPETWYQLGSFELQILNRPRDAYRDLNHSYTLDSNGPAGLKGGPLDQARCKIDPATCP